MKPPPPLRRVFALYFRLRFRFGLGICHHGSADIALPPRRGEGIDGRFPIEVQTWEEVKLTPTAPTGPLAKVWMDFIRQGVPVGYGFMDAIRQYEAQVLSQRR